MIAEAGDPVSLECPRERYKEYSEGLGSLIPPGDYTVRYYLLFHFLLHIILIKIFHSLTYGKKKKCIKFQ